MVLVFSSNANESRQIKREVERAVSKGLPVIPLRMEDVPLSKSLEYFISSPHWLDAMTPPVEKHLSYLADTVKLLLNRSHPNPQQEDLNRYDSSQNWSNYSVPSSAPQPMKPPAKLDYLTMGIVGMLIFSVLFVVGFLFSSWSDPLKNWLMGTPKNETKTDTASMVRNFSLNVEHSVVRSGQKGMLFHVRFQIVNAKGHNCAAMASFTYPNGTSVPAKNDYFTTTKKQLACWIRFTPGFDAARYDDLQLFMPYDQITTERGTHDYNFCLRIWDVQTAITDCITGGFYVTNN